jgi:hypothetical protein
MHLVNVSMARSVWLFRTEEMNPGGLDLRPLLTAVNQRYSFQKSPSAEDLISNTGLEFTFGGFSHRDQLITVAALKIFSDGLIAETKHSTEASDALLQDAINFAVERFGWSFDERMINGKAYFSEVTVEANVSIDGLGGKLQKMSELLSERSPERPFVPVGVKFGVDPGSPDGLRTPVFVLERRFDAPFESNRYFSQAPATTDRHLQLLDEIEKILGA